MTRRAAKFTPDSRSAQELAKAFLEHELLPAIGIDDVETPSRKVREIMFSELSIDHHLHGLLKRLLESDTSFGFTLEKGTIDARVKEITDFAFMARQFMTHMCVLEQYGTLKDAEKKTIADAGLIILEKLRDEYKMARMLAAPPTGEVRRKYGERIGEERRMEGEDISQGAQTMFSAALNNLDKLENILRNIAIKLDMKLAEPPNRGGQGR